MTPKILRPLGIIIGVCFVLFGIALFANPPFGGFKEKLSAISTIITGIFFVIYGVKGRELNAGENAEDNS